MKKTFKKIKKITTYIISFILSLIIIYYAVTSNINKLPNLDYIDNDLNEINIYNYEKAYVSRIVDGDTIEVIISNKKYKVRFIGVNCPEYTSKVEYYGKESTEYTTNLLKNKYVYLEKDISNTDKYNRLLRYIWLEIPNNNSVEETQNKMFNSILLSNGYAQIATYPPDIKYVDIFKDISIKARKNNTGLWNKQ
ncbi:MAG: thermonuclease family protein [Clostridia bacterium]